MTPSEKIVQIRILIKKEKAKLKGVQQYPELAWACERKIEELERQLGVDYS